MLHLPSPENPGKEETMITTRMPPLDLAVYGSSWRGWRIAPWGKARTARLTAPDGTNFEPGEILELRALAPNVDFLRLRVRELEALGLNHRQRVAVLAAIQALEQILRFRNGTLGFLDQHHGTLERVPVSGLDSFQDGVSGHRSDRHRNGSLDRD